MGFLILVGVVTVLAIAFLLSYRLMSTKRKGRVIPMVRIGMAENNVEVQIWAERLRVAGIGCRVQDVSAAGAATSPLYANAYGPELWVSERDSDEARDLLGM